MSSGAERFLDPANAQALHRLRNDVRSPVLVEGPMLEIAFPAANTRRDVQHGMGAIPTGFITIATQGGNVQSFDLANWTPALAFLQASVANTRVRGYFVITEVPRNA